MGMDLNPGHHRSLVLPRPCPRYQKSNKARQIDRQEQNMVVWEPKMDDSTPLLFPRHDTAQNILTLAFFV